MVSKASDDLPEPESPVITTSRSRGISRSIFLRLCSRAPLMIIRSAIRLVLCAAPWPATRNRPPGVFDRRDHAFRARLADAGDIVSGAMIGRGTNHRQSQCNIHGAVEFEGLKRYQTL